MTFKKRTTYRTAIEALTDLIDEDVFEDIANDLTHSTEGENPSYKILKSITDKQGINLTNGQIMNAGFLLALHVVTNSDALLEKYKQSKE